MRGIETLMREGQESEPVTVLRVDRELANQIDAYAKKLFDQNGVRVTRTAAAEALLRLGLRKADRR